MSEPEVECELAGKPACVRTVARLQRSQASDLNCAGKPREGVKGTPKKHYKQSVVKSPDLNGGMYVVLRIA